jgi:hypothetical protein
VASQANPIGKKPFVSINLLPREVEVASPSSYLNNGLVRFMIRAKNRLLAIQTPQGGRGFGDFGGGPTLWSGSRKDGWTAPPNSQVLYRRPELRIFSSTGRRMFSQSAFRACFVCRTKSQERTSETAPESFIPAGPNPPLTLQFPLASALNVATGEIAFRSQSTVTVLARNSDGTYSKKQSARNRG